MATRAGRAQAQAPPKRSPGPSRVRWTAQEDDLLLTLAERCLRPDGSPNWGAMYALPEARGALAGHMPPGGHTRDNSKHFYKRILKLAAGASTAAQGARAAAIMQAVRRMCTKPAGAGAGSAKRAARSAKRCTRAPAAKASEEAAIVAALKQKSEETAVLVARLKTLRK